MRIVPRKAHKKKPVVIAVTTGSGKLAWKITYLYFSR